MKPTATRTALPLLIAAALAGCGNDEQPPARPFVAVDRPEEPRLCPQPFGDPDGPELDARRLLGLREQEARAAAARARCQIRVVRRDEEVTGDLQVNRIDVELRNGFVVALRDQGWTSYAPLPGEQ